MFIEKQYRLFTFFSGSQYNFSAMLMLKAEALFNQCANRSNEELFCRPKGVPLYRLVAV